MIEYLLVSDILIEKYTLQISDYIAASI